MKRVIFMIILALMIPGLGAQDIYERVLADIETNSLTLITLREQLEADKLEINSGRFLSNPEVEFGYLWGKPSSIGNRMNYSIAQSIDFPLVYARKSSIARQQEANAELGYREERAIVLLEARENLVELLYINAMAAEYSYRIANAEAVADMFRKRMDSGASTVQEYNKANINLATVRREASNNEFEREAVLSRLKALNGGVDVIFDDSLFVGSELPASFNDWFVEMETNNPRLLRAKGVAEVAESVVKLQKANSMPKFSARYMSENVVGQTHQGVTLGISVPMWENKNRVKSAVTRANASKLAAEDTGISLYNSLKSVYDKAKGLTELTESYRSALERGDNRKLLENALEKGEISLLDYLVEIGFYYDAVDNLLETEKDRELAISYLWAAGL